MDYVTQNFKLKFTESDPLVRSNARDPRAKGVPRHASSATTGNVAIDSYDFEQLIARADLGFDIRTKDAYYQRLTHLVAHRDQARTEQILRTRKEHAMAKKAAKLEQRHAGAYTESALIGEMDNNGASNAEEHENLRDHVGEETVATKVGVPLHATDDGSETVHTLNAFFERPFSIYDAAWNADTEYNIALKVWDLWSKKPAVRNKLANYAYFRGTLHVKIAMSGTPFHYGLLMASYQPYAKYNDNIKAYDDMLLAPAKPAVANTQILYKAYLAQAPGAKTMDIKENRPMEIEIPFISYKQKFRLFNNANTVITNSTSFHDFEEAGELRLTTLNRFKVANSDYSGPVSVNVFAWCSGIELGTITGTNMDITAESKIISVEARPRTSGKKSAQKTAKKIAREASDLEDELSDEDDSWGARYDREQAQRSSNWQKSKENKPMYSGKGSIGSRFMDSLEKGGDEYSEPGPVSKIATAVAGVGESLQDIPVIGGFAKATTTIAKGVGRVASWFGWSKPEILDKASFVKNQPFQNGAILSGAQTEYKIACDPKNELTVDPSIGGVDGDDMALARLCATKSFIGSFTWKDTDVAMTDVLWKTGISPMMGVFLGDLAGTGGNTHYFQDSAMSFAARPFTYWRGNIKLTFEIVCSKFHRGKLLFRYEPNTSQYGLIASSPAQLNQQNTTILDIQNGQQITFDIDWAQMRSWAVIPVRATDWSPIQYTNDIRGDTTTPYIPGLDASTQTFHADEMNGVLEVRVLNELVQPTPLSDVSINVYAWSDDMSFALPTERHLPTNRSYSVQSAIIGTEHITEEHAEEKLVQNSSSMDKIHLDHMGEKVVSLRSLLKRFTTVSWWSKSVASIGIGYFNLVNFNIPVIKNGPKPSGYTPSGNHEERHLFQYMKWSYMGLRGGMKHRVRIFGDTNPSLHSYSNVRLLQADDSFDTSAIGIAQYANSIGDLTNGAVDGVEDYPIHASLANRIDGGINYHHASNGGIEYVTPYYSSNLFEFSFCADPAGYGNDTIGGHSAWWCNKHAVAIAANPTLSSNVVLLEDIATGEDFTFFRFQGASPFGINSGG